MSVVGPQLHACKASPLVHPLPRSVLPGADGSCPTAYEYDSSTQLCHTVFSLGVRYVGALYW